MQEAKSLPFVGERLADKIWEIAQSGHLRRLDHVDEKEKLVETFKKIWGVGATSARRFVQMVSVYFFTKTTTELTCIFISHAYLRM